MQARLAGGAPVHALELRRELGFWVWRAETADGVALYDARTGDRIEVTAEQARRLAEERYFGEGSVRKTRLVREATLEARGHPLPLWRVDFADAHHTRYYVSPREGRILERRTDTWALFDVLWMLHTMDYSGRDDFNTPWVIAFAVGALWLAISGAFLLVKSFDTRSRPRMEP